MLEENDIAEKKQQEETITEQSENQSESQIQEETVQEENNLENNQAVRV